MEIGVLISDFAQQLLRQNTDLPPIYLTPLDAACISPTLVLNQNVRAKLRGRWVLAKYERQKLQKPYTQGVRQFSHSKPFYTKYTLATRNFKRMKAFAWFKKEICCMDFISVDELAKENNGVKYLQVRQFLFD